MYEYACNLVRIVDADSLRVDVDMGFHTWLHNAALRLLRIDAPERYTDEGKAATAWLEQFLMGKRLVVTTYKGDSFGRWLAEVTADGTNVSDALVEAGHAVYRTW